MSSFVPNTSQISLAEYDSNCDQITPWWVLSFLIALVTVPYRCEILIFRWLAHSWRVALNYGIWWSSVGAVVQFVGMMPCPHRPVFRFRY